MNRFDVSRLCSDHHADGFLLLVIAPGESPGEPDSVPLVVGSVGPSPFGNPLPRGSCGVRIRAHGVPPADKSAEALLVRGEDGTQ